MAIARHLRRLRRALLAVGIVSLIASVGWAWLRHAGQPALRQPPGDENTPASLSPRNQVQFAIFSAHLRKLLPEAVPVTCRDGGPGRGAMGLRVEMELGHPDWGPGVKVLLVDPTYPCAVGDQKEWAARYRGTWNGRLIFLLGAQALPAPWDEAVREALAWSNRAGSGGKSVIRWNWQPDEAARVIAHIRKTTADRLLFLLDDQDILETTQLRLAGGPAQTSVLRGTPGEPVHAAKYGFFEVEDAEEFLSTRYERPWTMPKVLAWCNECKDPEVKAAWLWILAASGDGRALVTLGRSLERSEWDQGDPVAPVVAAVYGLLAFYWDDDPRASWPVHSRAAWTLWRSCSKSLEREVGLPPATKPATRPDPPLPAASHAVCQPVLPADMELLDLAWSADSRHLHAAVKTPAINVWGVIVWYWPRIVTGLSVVLSVVLLRRIRWLVRNRQIVGLPYCRACNYCLHGLEASRCPECGGETGGRNRVTGKSMRGRIMRRGAAVALLLGASLYLSLAQVPHQGRASDWFQCDSAWLHRFATDHKIKSYPARQTLFQVVRIDSRTGRIVECAFSQRLPGAAAASNQPARMWTSAGCGTLAVRSGSQLHLLDGASARWQRSITVGEVATGECLSWEGRTLFQAHERTLRAWDLAANSPVSRSLPLPEIGDDGTHLVALPHDRLCLFRYALSGGYVIVDARTGEPIFGWLDKPWFRRSRTPSPALSGDGRQMACCPYGRSLLWRELDGSSQVVAPPPPVKDDAGWGGRYEECEVALTPDGTRLLTALPQKNSTEVRMCRAGEVRWLARFEPAGVPWSYRPLLVSPDGRRALLLTEKANQVMINVFDIGE